MQHQYPRLHQSLQRESEQNVAFTSAVLRGNESLNYNDSAARAATPFVASVHRSSNEFVQHMSNSTSSHQTAPAEQAWDIASSNANRLMAKLSHLKNTIRTVRERTGEGEPPTFPDMHLLSPFPVHMWDSADPTGDGAQYSEPHPPPASPPIPNEAGAAYMSYQHQQSNVVLPSPPAFFSPKSQLPSNSNSTLLNKVQHPPHSRALVSPLLQKPHQLPAVENIRAGAFAMQPAPDSQEVDANLRSYISSLEERVSALTFENNKLKSSNESMHMTIQSFSHAAPADHVNDPALWQQQQNLKAALEQRVSSLQRQSELVQVFDAACVNQSELIGDGSFGQVRMGQLTLPVAVKTARRLGQGVGGGSDAAREISLKQEEQLFREASLQGALRHPGVVSALGISILEGGQVALITELVKGRSLEDILHSKKISLSIQETVTIAIQLADALAYLHHRSVVHRDVKPGNILVSSDMIVKLCDFGLACRYSMILRLTLSLHTNITQFFSRLFCRLQGRSSDHVPRAGTPVYLAPETLSNKSGSVNEPVDVYRCKLAGAALPAELTSLFFCSFAIVCWEMCTGQQIWSELIYSEMEKQVLSGNRPPIPPHVPSAFANMIRACWDQVRSPYRSLIFEMSLQHTPACC